MSFSRVDKSTRRHSPPAIDLTSPKPSLPLISPRSPSPTPLTASPSADKGDRLPAWERETTYEVQPIKILEVST
jgi:hypothetical protein